MQAVPQGAEADPVVSRRVMGLIFESKELFSS